MIDPYYQFDPSMFEYVEDEEEERRPSLLGSLARGAGIGALGGMGIAGAHGMYSGAHEWKNVHRPQHARLDAASAIDSQPTPSTPKTLDDYDAQRMQQTLPPGTRQRMQSELPQSQGEVQWDRTQLGRGALYGAAAGGATGLLLHLLRR